MRVRLSPPNPPDPPCQGFARPSAAQLRRAVEAWSRAAAKLPDVLHELSMLELEWRLTGHEDAAQRLIVPMANVRELLERRSD